MTPSPVLTGLSGGRRPLFRHSPGPGRGEHSGPKPALRRQRDLRSGSPVAFRDRAQGLTEGAEGPEASAPQGEEKGPGLEPGPGLPAHCAAFSGSPGGPGTEGPAIPEPGQFPRREGRDGSRPGVPAEGKGRSSDSGGGRSSLGEAHPPKGNPPPRRTGPPLPTTAPGFSSGRTFRGEQTPWGSLSRSRGPGFMKAISPGQPGGDFSPGPWKVRRHSCAAALRPGYI